MSGVYIIGRKDQLNSTKPILVKIGLSKHPDKRLAQLQTGNRYKKPYKLYIYGVIETDDQSLETKIHRAWKPNRTNGEWFKLTWTQIELIMEHYKINTLLAELIRSNRAVDVYVKDLNNRMSIMECENKDLRSKLNKITTINNLHIMMEHNKRFKEYHDNICDCQKIESL